MYNRTILVGRLTADPELKQTQSGIAVTSFSIAVNRSYTGKQGEKQTDFIDLVAWRQTAEFICRYFSKGKAILVEGEIQTRAYVDKQGQNRRVWEVLVDKAHFVESKSAGRQEASAPVKTVQTEQEAVGFAELDDDGDLPF